MPNFKSPGPDGIQNFWRKQLDAPENLYARVFDGLIQHEKVMDEWLTKGNNFLISKSEETQAHYRYRLKMCLLYEQHKTSKGNNHRKGIKEAKTQEQKGCKLDAMAK